MRVAAGNAPLSPGLPCHLSACEKGSPCLEPGALEVPAQGRDGSALRSPALVGHHAWALNGFASFSGSSGRRLQAVPVMRSHEVEVRAKGNNAVGVDAFVGAEVVLLDRRHIHRVGNARHLVKLTQVV